MPTSASPPTLTSLPLGTPRTHPLLAAASNGNYWLGGVIDEVPPADLPRLSVLTLRLAGGAQPQLPDALPGLRFVCLQTGLGKLLGGSHTSRFALARVFPATNVPADYAWWLLVLVDDLALAAATLREAGADFIPGLEHWVLEPPSGP